ncbi:WG repeat-containing protein [Fluviicola taffensis]|uniref:KWG Leptospira repeat protein n=1 Tax=Fluviicola taffensis (strain DSM 16823 / NCIMB 13979 / RW262) TaxID=755732 RepID=F2ID35_FLUTR|nr:WG repeat-containing protein [Fluviicola taffensis]AEA44429.1 hypothetical protein Fluta_2444 [Fluviicola taffensis DSM 16823]
MIRLVVIAITSFLSLFSAAQFEEEIDNKEIYGGAYTISKNAAGQYGVTSRKGEIKVPFVYSRIIENDLGLFVFKINKSNGFERSYSLGYYDHQFKMVLPCQYNSLLSLEDGLIIGSQNLDKKFGLVDTLGRIIIPFEYDEMFAPTESLFLTKLNGKYGYISKKNNVIIDHEFTFAAPFSEGFAAASKSNLIGFIDRKGNFEIEQKFTSADEFHFGYAQVFFHNQTSLVDQTGKILFPFIFRSIEAVGNNQFVFEANESLRANIERNLPKLQIAQKMEELSMYDTLITGMDSEIDSEPLEERFMGVMDLTGKLIGGNGFQQVIPLFSVGTNQLYAVQKKSDSEDDSSSNYLFALMDETGKLLSEYRFFEVKADEKIVVEETEKGFIDYRVDANGKLVKIQ